MMLSMLQTKRLCGGLQDVCYLNIFKKLEMGSADGACVYTVVKQRSTRYK